MRRVVRWWRCRAWERRDIPIEWVEVWIGEHKIDTIRLKREKGQE